MGQAVTPDFVGFRIVTLPASGNASRATHPTVHSGVVPVLGLLLAHGECAEFLESGVGVAAQATDEGALALERPIAPRAGARPLLHSGVAGECGAAQHSNVVHAVVAGHRGDDRGRVGSVELHRAAATQASGLGPDIGPRGLTNLRVCLFEIKLCLNTTRVGADVGLEVRHLHVGDNPVGIIIQTRLETAVYIHRDVDVLVAQSRLHLLETMVAGGVGAAGVLLIDGRRWVGGVLGGVRIAECRPGLGDNMATSECGAQLVPAEEGVDLNHPHITTALRAIHPSRCGRIVF